MNDFLNTDNVSIRISAIVFIDWYRVIDDKECVEVQTENKSFYLFYDKDFNAIKELCSISDKKITEYIYEKCKRSLDRFGKSSLNIERIVENALKNNELKRQEIEAFFAVR